VRCFLAVELPEPVREAIAAVEARLRADVGKLRVTWVAPANLHLTLRFLGEIDEARAGRVVEAVERVTAVTAPIDVEAAGLGLFPGPVRPRVVWVGLGAGASPSESVARGAVAVGRLARAVELALVPVGFPPEARPFRAHLTIGRIRDGGRTRDSGRIRDGSTPDGGRMRHGEGETSGLVDALAAAGAPRFGAWTVRDVVLFRSHLGPRGPRYEALRRFPLAGAMAS